MKKIIFILLSLLTCGIVYWVWSVETIYERFQKLEIEKQKFIEEQEQKNILSWTASRYAYWIWQDQHFSDTHRTCAFHHQFKDYGTYKVCNVDNWKCVECFNNDRMRREDRLVDLSNYAFSQIASLRKWLIKVTVERIE